MLYQCLRRVVSFVLTLIFATLAIFLVLEILPGDPAVVMLGPDATEQMIASVRTELGLDQPVVWRFFEWVGAMLTGDFGTSYSYKVPVSGLILDRLAVTLPLALMAIVLTVIIAVTAGVYAAANSKKLGGQMVMAATQIGIAIPNFWFGLILVLVFAVGLRWFPSNGFPGWSAGFWSSVHALFLPAISLAMVQAAILTRVTRASLLEVLQDDFIRTARSKGLSRRAVLWKHGLQNALIPIATIMGLQFAHLVAGTIVIENVFALPGLGNLIFQAVGQRDLVVIRSVVVILAAMVVLINFIVDIAYVLIDPRLRVRQ